MAIEDHPAWANHLHAQQIEQGIQSAALEYRSAGAQLKSATKALQMLQGDWLETREEYAEQLNSLNGFILHYSNKIDMIVPSSVWPSLIIDDPETPASDEEAAKDYKQTIMETHTYDEIAELFADMEALRDLRKKRKACIEMHKVNSQGFPKMIAEQKANRDEAETAVRQTRKALDKARELRPDSVTRYLNSRGIGSLNPDRYPPPRTEDIPPQYMHYFNIPLTPEQVATSANAKDIVEKAEQNALDAAVKAEKAIKAQERADARAAESQREKEVLQQRIDVLIGEVEGQAEYTPEQLKALQQSIKLDLHPADYRPDGSLKPIGRAKEFINERQPLGRMIDVLFKPNDTHGKREMALRAGVYIEGVRFKVLVKEHAPNDDNPRGNIFRCVLQEEGCMGKECRLALGPDRNQSWQVLTVFNNDKRWTPDFENSMHPKVPRGAKSDYTFSYQQLIAFHKLLTVKMLQG